MPEESECETKRTDTVLRALADERRRCVIAYLSRTSSGAVSVSELADYVAAHCSDAHDASEVTIRLHHGSLPKLEASGLLEYDPHSKTVQYRPKPAVENLLDHLDEHGW